MIQRLECPLIGLVSWQDGGVLLVATTRENVSPSLVLELLKRIGGIIKVIETSMPPLFFICIAARVEREVHTMRRLLNIAL